MQFGTDINQEFKQVKIQIAINNYQQMQEEDKEFGYIIPENMTDFIKELSFATKKKEDAITQHGLEDFQDDVEGSDDASFDFMSLIILRKHTYFQIFCSYLSILLCVTSSYMYAYVAAFGDEAITPLIRG